jgi:hypothetical protein
MKKLLTMATLLLPIGLAGCSHPQPAHYYLPPPPPLAGAVMAQQGNHDGVDAIQRDVVRGVDALCCRGERQV